MNDAKLQARRRGEQLSLTMAEYWALPDIERDVTELWIEGEWVRPDRFGSDGSDVEFE